MTHEKSCGALVLRRGKDETDYILMIRQGQISPFRQTSLPVQDKNINIPLNFFRIQKDAAFFHILGIDQIAGPVGESHAFGGGGSQNPQDFICRVPDFQGIQSGLWWQIAPVIDLEPATGQ